MLYTGNPERGCGFKSDGYYLTGESGARGTLAPVTVTMGDMLLGGENLHFDLEPIVTHWIDPERTVDTQQIHFMEPSMGDRRAGIYTGAERPQVARLGMYAAAHHVGATYYTPFQHMHEVALHGPSLRVDARVAQALAPYLPMRIFFHFDKLPMFRDQEHYEHFTHEVLLTEFDAYFGSLKRISNGFRWDDILNAPTWSFYEWGGRIGEDQGLWHASLPICAFLDVSGDWLDLRGEPGIFYYSWITSAVKAVSAETANVDPEDLDAVSDLDEYDFLDENDRKAGVRARIIRSSGDV